MRFSNSISLILVLCTRVLAAPGGGLQARDLNSFVVSEKAVALQGALNNIGPNGSMVPGAGAGLVVASPSKANPNCEFGFPTMEDED
jgi:glucoamylase